MKPPWEFKENNFYSSVSVQGFSFNACDAARQANATLAEWFKSAKRVFGSKDEDDCFYWTNGKCLNYETHQGILIDIKPVAKKTCEHKNWCNNLVKTEFDNGIMATTTSIQCNDCGATLKPTSFEEVK